MRVTVRLFARLRDVVGAHEVGIDVADGGSIDDVWAALAAAHPAVAPFRASLSAALNDDYAKMTAPVADGDEVAFLPPVSGG